MTPSEIQAQEAEALAKREQDEFDAHVVRTRAKGNQTEAVETLLGDENSRQIYRQFAAAVAVSSGRPVFIDELAQSDRFKVYAGASELFAGDRKAEIVKLLRQAFPLADLRDGVSVAGGRTEKPAERKVITISRSEARNLGTYLAKKAEAEKLGASLQIKPESA
jgi:hypothetical protein